MEWTGKYAPNPVSINPKKGFITGWNGKSTPSFNNPDSRYFGPYNRGLWLERQLKDMKNMTMDDMMKVQKRIGTAMSTNPGLNEAGILVSDFLPLLQHAIELVPENDPNYEKIHNVYDLLSKWDGQGIGDVVTSNQFKPEQLIFDNWVKTLLNNVFDDELNGLVSFSPSEDERINMLLLELNEPGSMSRDYFDNIQTPQVETNNQVVLESFVSALDQLTAKFQTSDISKWKVARPLIQVKHPVFGVINQFPYQDSETYSFMVRFNGKNEHSKGIGTPVGISRWPYGVNATIGLNPNGTPDVANPNIWKMLNLYQNYQYRKMDNFKE